MESVEQLACKLAVVMAEQGEIFDDRKIMQVIDGGQDAMDNYVKAQKLKAKLCVVIAETVFRYDEE
jgi:hypothetical protein